LTLVATAVLLVAGSRRLESYSSSPYPLVRNVPFRAAAARLAASGGALPADLDRLPIPVPLTLKRGETLSEVFSGLGLTPGDAREATAAIARWADPRRLRSGDRYLALFSPDSHLTQLELTLAGKGRVQLTRRAAGWESAWLPFARSIELAVVRGRLDGSLEGSIREAGGDPAVAYRMAEILQWDLDFNRDLRKGDRFELLYEEVFLDGQPDSVGQVVALSYENDGRIFEAYRFGEEGFYYDGSGRPMRKMFLRSPLPYSRITSRFTHRRFHPVLKRYRPHYGVDYGAPTGTPVRVTASGSVTFAAWDRGGGRTVKVRHPNSYLTAYLHLSRFAPGVSPGRRVRQGDVIGYVGATGLATAPHLDYRVQHHGRWIDPLTLKGVRAEPIPQARMAQFLAWRDSLRTAWATEDASQLTALVRSQDPIGAPVEAPPGNESLPSPGAQASGRR
jgi:murein DD-endopeptidase MepM/ murein hydrolase activator NlpD